MRAHFINLNLLPFQHILANNSSTPQSNAASNVSGVNHRTSNTTPSESPSPRSSYHGPPPASLLLVNRNKFSNWLLTQSIDTIIVIIHFIKFLYFFPFSNRLHRLQYQILHCMNHKCSHHIVHSSIITIRMVCISKKILYFFFFNFHSHSDRFLIENVLNDLIALFHYRTACTSTSSSASS